MLGYYRARQPNDLGYLGEFGGPFVPEALVTVLEQLEQNFREVLSDASF